MSEQSAPAPEPMSFDDIQEPIVKTSGDHTIGDETEQLADAVSTTKEKKEIAKLEKQLSKEGSNGKEKESQKEEKELLSKNAEQKDESDAVKDQSKQSDKSFRVIKASVDGKALDLRDDAIIPTKVNGKTEKPTLAELQKDYSGRVDYTRKYQDFHNERKTFTVEKEGFNSEKTQTISQINKFWKMVTEEGDPLNAAVYMAELLGEDPEEARGKYLEARSNLRKQLREMTDEQLAELDQKTETEYWKKKDQYRKQDEQRSREHADIAKRVDAIRSQNNITPEAFRQCYEDLASEAKRSNIDVKSITPEMVAQYHAITERRSKINEYVTSSFTEEKAPVIAKQLKEVWDKNPDLSIEDIKDIGTQAFGTKGRSALAKKVIEQKQKAPREPQHESFSWEDIT